MAEETKTPTPTPKTDNEYLEAIHAYTKQTNKYTKDIRDNVQAFFWIFVGVPIVALLIVGAAFIFGMTLK